MANNRKQYQANPSSSSTYANNNTFTMQKRHTASSQAVHYSGNRKRSQEGYSDSNRPTKRARYDQSKFSGDYAEQYRELYESVKKHPCNERDIKEIGYVAKGKMLFSTLQAAKDMGATFLNAFWQDDANRQLVINQHHNKYAAIGKNEPLPSSCISFISLTIDKEQYCLVARSCSSSIGYKSGKGTGAKPRPEETTLNESLAACANRLNQNITSTGVKYLLITEGMQENYMNLLAQISGQSLKYKSCSEKTLGIMLVKLFHQYGKRMFITGQVNYSLYPYEAGQHYGRHPQSIDSTVFESRDDSHRVILANNLVTDQRPCCASCLTHKNAMLQVLHAAQTIGEQNAQHQERKHDLLMSPLHHSVTEEFSSLLPQMGLFAQSKNTSVLSKNSATSNSCSNVEEAQSYLVNDCPPAPSTPEFKEFYYEDGSKIVMTEDYEIVESYLVNTTESNLQQAQSPLVNDCPPALNTPEYTPEYVETQDEDGSIEEVESHSMNTAELNDVDDENEEKIGLTNTLKPKQ